MNDVYKISREFVDSNTLRLLENKLKDIEEKIIKEGEKLKYIEEKIKKL